MHFNHFCK